MTLYVDSFKNGVVFVIKEAEIIFVGEGIFEGDSFKVSMDLLVLSMIQISFSIQVVERAIASCKMNVMTFSN